MPHSQNTPDIHVPLVEKLKSITGVVGIRLGEEAHYKLVKNIGDIEIRHYDPMLLASTHVDGMYDEASNDAFMRLSAYIYGKNSTGRTFAMTAPVFEEKDAQSALLSMPVFQEKSINGCKMSFVLPHNISLDSAPRPDDPSIHLSVSAPQIIAALKYSGKNTLAQKEDAAFRLLNELGRHENIKICSAVFWAQYDPEFALAFMRKNEAQVKIELLN
jgi:hypothetical protein